MQTRVIPAIVVLVANALTSPGTLEAQTDYYNTDAGRPLRVEDAYPVERRAFEIQAAPFRVERSSGGIYRWSIEPELAYGILPRMQVEVGVPLAVIDAGGQRRSGVSGVDVSALYNLNIETAIPAFGIAASALLPAGSLAPDDPSFAVKGIATRTFIWARFHLNGEYTFVDEPDPASASGTGDPARWTAGLAVDRTFPLKALLVGAEVVLAQPLEDDADRIFSAGAGFRYQLDPRWALDAGFGKRLTGDERPWYATFGTAYAFGLPWHR